VHRRILTSHAVSYYVKRSLHKRSLTKILSQGKLSTPVIFPLRHFGHLFHRIKTRRNNLHQQARNQLVTPGGAKSFLRGAKFFTRCPTDLNCVQNILLGANIFLGGLCPLCHPCLRTCSLAYLFRIYNRMDI